MKERIRQDNKQVRPSSTKDKARGSAYEKKETIS
jgi:hypothetical protein